jgi:hypothetical protein
MPNVVDKAALFAKIGYTPHSHGQFAFHASDARFRVACCGRRYGKSTMAGRDFEPRLFEPEKRYWIVGPTYDLGEKEFRVIWNDLIIGQQIGKDKRVKKNYSKRSGEMYIEMPWQTRIEVRSAQHPETLVGEGLSGVIMSEAAKHHAETWERFIRPALSDFRGDAVFPTTPEGHNWLYEIWQYGRHPGFPEYESWRFPSWENPIVYPGGRNDSEILQIERTTSPEWFAQEIGADFSSFIGRIFGEFDETVHVQQHQFNPLWPNYMGMDWGFTHPMACIEFQVSPMGSVHVWREYYKSFWSLENHIIYLKTKRDNPPGYHLDGCFGDAADPDAALYVSSHFCGCLADPMAKSNWRRGIDLMKTYMRLYETGSVLDEYGTPEQRPLLTVSPDCQRLIHEFNMYRAPESLNSGTRETNSNSVAVKEDDDGLDALRYAMMHLFELGAQHHLEETITDWAPSAYAPVVFGEDTAAFGIEDIFFGDNVDMFGSLESKVF